MSSVPTTQPRVLCAYITIEDWIKLSSAQRRKLFTDFITYCGRVGAIPWFMLREVQEDEVPEVHGQADAFCEFCRTFDTVPVWCRRLWMLSGSPAQLTNMTNPDFYTKLLTEGVREAREMGALFALDTEPYGKENWIDPFQSKCPLSLGATIADAVVDAQRAFAFVSADVVMPFGSQVPTSLMWSFGALASQFHVNWSTRYAATVKPHPPSHYTRPVGVSSMHGAHVAPTKVPIPGSSVLVTRDPLEFHGLWGPTVHGEVVNSMFLYTASVSDLQSVLSSLVALTF